MVDKNEKEKNTYRGHSKDILSKAAESLVSSDIGSNGDGKLSCFSPSFSSSVFLIPGRRLWIGHQVREFDSSTRPDDSRLKPTRPIFGVLAVNADSTSNKEEANVGGRRTR